MAPKRKSERKPLTPSQSPAANPTAEERRQTRSMTANASLVIPPEKAPSPAVVAQPKRKRGRKPAAEKLETVSEEPKARPKRQSTRLSISGDSGGAMGDAAGKVIIIEACTQCKSFKDRANTAKNGLEKAVPGVTVIINPAKPRRGYFEIREEEDGGKVFISLPSMKRPFTPMKKLNMDELVDEIASSISLVPS